ncbi:hypothetical protein Q7O_003229 [Pectobacterium carotovorum subsp. carotovorum PCCS1]|nr:hypothetical protein [Pectobacterium carotovorum subsp. carotovorum PCCS1]
MNLNKNKHLRYRIDKNRTILSVFTSQITNKLLFFNILKILYIK